MGILGEEFEKLVQIMETLRSDHGCEWDRSQTHESLKPYLIEEAYELLDAIDEKNNARMIEELGDVLLQVIFHAQIAKERGAFDIADVLKTLREKLVRRHPHVFGDSPGYSYEQWERIKSQEKGAKKSSAIGNLNKALPALSLARRIQENAAAVGFDWPDVSGAMEKVREEVRELEEAIQRENLGSVEEELGDLLFAVVNVARFSGVDPELALRRAVEKFANRFAMVEDFAKKRGLELKKMTLEQLDALWEEAKGGE
ncbi:MAG: nucleoside triphosphate pyrophosphohydrolase [Pseudothermotoga sp.]|uniref:nucleoside triphosphate pyrophosphohydrolase n=1 Tax=Pseudothermotoga sp. TaxID=2033661 RepID=UPI000A786769|nr:nucleoside triphosphate pyrophosphohydrolase [Pseudothermotoga sp.]MDK2924021.1 tetrapyrrole methylase family protein / MazG family protein [Pseudothermotoga sp.]HBT39007.1 nucleoside triphosphate pyrophosphohydrolase [Pseudothermotoga sp.]HCO97711.1 nucleoside triphosphate pyrophosphohydrolase [Pseudothermotoga sp.]